MFEVPFTEEVEISIVNIALIAESLLLMFLVISYYVSWLS